MKNYFDVKKSFIETREEDDQLKIAGIIPYNSRSLDMGFYEEIKPTAFNKTIKDGADVKLLQNHDTMKPLARTKNQTMVLRNEEDGLHFEATLNKNISFHRDVFESIKSGIADGVSFGFQVIKDSFRKADDKIIRELQEVRLFEISAAVTFPAYQASEAYVREVRELYEESIKNELSEENLPEETTEEREDDNKDKEQEIVNNELEEARKRLTLLQNYERQLELLGKI